MREGPIVPNQTPMQILALISDKRGDSLWPSSEGKDQDANAGNRARVFTDVLKEHSDNVQLEEFQLTNLKKMITGLELPVKPEFINEVLKQLEGVAPKLTEDPQWNEFWKGIQEKYNLKDDEVKQRQGDVINGYRMKIFAMAQRVIETESREAVKFMEAVIKDPDNEVKLLKEKNFELERVIEVHTKQLEVLNKEDPINNEEVKRVQQLIDDDKKTLEKNKAITFELIDYKRDPNLAKIKLNELKEKQGKILLCKDLVLKVNIADRDAGKGNSRSDYVQGFYKEKVALNILMKFQINEIITKAVDAMKAGKSEKEVKELIKKEIDEQWKAISETPLGNPNGDKYLQLYGSDKGKEIFEEFFNEKAMLGKANQYFKAQRSLGFDPDERLLAIERLKNTQDSGLDHKDKLVIDDYLVKLTEMVYFPKKDIRNNDGLKKVATLEEHNIELVKLKEVFNKVSLKAAQDGNFELLEKCANIGIVSGEKTANYSRSIGEAFSDAFEGFPRNLGKLFSKPERTPLQIAKMKGMTQLEELIANPPQLPPLKVRFQEPENELLDRLSTLEQKVQNLQDKIPDLMRTDRTVLNEMKTSEIEEKYGSHLATNPEFVEGITKRNPELLDKVFQNAMMEFCADIHDDKRFKTPMDQFRNVVDGLAKSGYPSAIFFKSQVLLGKEDSVKSILGVKIDCQDMYPKNEIAGSQEAMKVKPDEKITVHPNLEQFGKPSASELLSRDNVVQLKENKQKV